MANILEGLRRPYGREYWELIRSGREGIYRQAADGLIVRLAVAEAAHEADVVARALARSRGAVRVGASSPTCDIGRRDRRAMWTPERET